MSFVEPTLSVNFLNYNNAASLLKMLGIGIVTSLVLSGIIALIVYIVMSQGISTPAVIGAGIGVFISILMCNLFALRTFELWDGCYFKKESSE